MKSLLITLLLLTSLFDVFSQAYSPLKVKPEDILLAEKLQKEYPKEDYVSLSTVATYKFNYSTKSKKVEASLHYEEEIMSLKEDKDFKNTVIYDSLSDIEKVYGYDYKNHIKYIRFAKSGYASADIFYDDAKMFNYSFHLESRGDKTNYYYDKKYFDIKYLTSVYAHTHYPVLEKKIIFEIPKWLTLDFVDYNFNGFNITKTESFDTKKDANIITYSIKNIKPIKPTDYSSSWQTSLPHVLILSKKYDYKGNTFTLFSSTKDLYNWYSSLIKEVDNNPEDLKSLVNEITSGIKSDEEKIEKIFYWVQDNIRYIAFENGIMGFKPENSTNVLKKKYGDCKGMANLTCEMLKIAGYDARLTWIGTRSIPYDYSTPSLAVDNHMITTLFLNDKKYYLDATETGVAFKDYAHRIQGQAVLIEDKESYILDKVPEFDAKHNEEKIVLTLTIEDDYLVGRGENTYNGEEKNILFREIGSVAKIDLDKRASDYLAHKDKNNNISKVEITNYNNRNLPIAFKYNIVATNRITTVSKEKYLNLEFDFNLNDVLAEEDQILDMDFGHKTYLNSIVTCKIPMNYKVDFLPENINIDNDEFTFNLNYNFNSDTQTISYTKKMILKNGSISRSNFEVWNKTIKELKKFYNEQIILITG